MTLTNLLTEHESVEVVENLSVVCVVSPGNITVILITIPVELSHPDWYSELRPQWLNSLFYKVEINVVTAYQSYQSYQLLTLDIESDLTIQMRLKTNAIYLNTISNETSQELFEKRKSVVLVHDDAIIIDVEHIVRILVLQVFVYLWSDVWVARLIHVVGMILRTLREGVI